MTDNNDMQRLHIVSVDNFCVAPTINLMNYRSSKTAFRVVSASSVLRFFMDSGTKKFVGKHFKRLIGVSDQEDQIR